MTLRKWNYEAKRYEPYAIDPEWVVVGFTEDLDLPINCSSCGRAMIYGDGYTSLEIHNLLGLGCPVCEACYDLELKRKREATGGRTRRG